MRTERFTEQLCDEGKTVTAHIAPGEMRVILRGGRPAMVEFQCPCGCGQYCSLFVSPDGPREEGGRRYWGYAPGPTLHPSVRWEAGCRAHFEVTGGAVKWAGD